MLNPLPHPIQDNAHRVLNPDYVCHVPLGEPAKIVISPDVDQQLAHLSVGLRIGDIVNRFLPDNPPTLMPLRLGDEFATIAIIETFLQHVSSTHFPLALMGQEEWLVNNPVGLDYIPMEPFGAEAMGIMCQSLSGS